MHNENGAGFCAGFLAGAALGAMAAALFTPRSSPEVRRRLVDEGERLRDRTSGMAQDMRARGDEALDKTRVTAREAVEGFKEAAAILRTGKSGAVAEESR